MSADRTRLTSLVRWFDSGASNAPVDADDDRIDWLRCIPFVVIHLLCLGIIWVGFSWTALAIAAGLYVIRMFAITGFYHRYFSHRTFRTSRPFQFLMALAGSTAAQRGPMWWAAHHRHHHNHSDGPEDAHSPGLHGFWRSHVGWFMARPAFTTRTRLVRDWLRFPELRWLDRFDWVVPVALLGLLLGLGWTLGRVAPDLGTSGLQLAVWGFGVSTVAVYHATYTINSLAHQFGSRRYRTGDDSRNNLWLALLTLGEGWHNNHHHYPAAARQGFYWWEIDVTYYGLVLLRRLGLIWDLRPVPLHALERDRLDRGPAAGAS
ncbi:MAG: acyl-CoA desaturase [Planctomycetota bacterium]|jgi:stearoyl-CoA desaturase (delta-9 desaturase)